MLLEVALKSVDARHKWEKGRTKVKYLSPQRIVGLTNKSLGLRLIKQISIYIIRLRLIMKDYKQIITWKMIWAEHYHGNVIIT